MPVLSFPITFSLAPLPTGLALNASDYATQIVANLQATIAGSFLTGQIGGNAPTQNVGPWANNGHWWFWDSVSQTYIQESLTSTFPTGSILCFGGSSTPTGFLLCDGTSYLRADQNALFNIIGTNYGSLNSSVFNVPDIRGRVTMGAGTGNALSARIVGDIPGEEGHVLSVDELASHAHAVSDPTHNHGHADPSHAHGVNDPTHSHLYVSDLATTAGAGTSVFAATGTAISTSASATGIGIQAAVTGVSNIAAATSIGIVANGSSTAHNNIQPSIVMNFFIKN